MSVELRSGIVRVLTPDGETSGAGFVVTEEGLIATCAHVIEAAGAGPGGNVGVVFLATGEARQATGVPDWWRKPTAEDVAILRLEGPLPQRVKPLPLGSSRGTSNHSFKTFGFPDASPEEGIWGDGHILEATELQEVEVLQLSSPQVTPGFSGAPVLDIITRRVVGMVTSIAVPDRHGRLAETAFTTPAERLQEVCTVLRMSDMCPYRSLDAFTEADAEFFCGRDRVVERFLVNLRREPRFLAVLGPSGSGKSSLVRAGLIPQLRQGAVPGSHQWGMIVIRPANQPFSQLEAQGLKDASGSLVGAVQAWLDHHPKYTRLALVIDQFEEVLVTCPEPLRQVFVAQLKRLLEFSLPITIILVMRDDFYGRFAQQVPDLVAWLERGLVNVPPTLTQDELKTIVEEPAQAIGLSFEAGLVEAILDDALESAPEAEGRVGRSTILPLLEFSLAQLWERRRDGALTHEAYGAIGGVTGGLAQWADRAFYDLEDEQQRRLSRRLLTDLVHLGDESQGLPDSRRQRSLAALCRDEREREAVHEVVRRLAGAQARLLVTGRELETGQETVELIHDALLREWSLLQSWLNEDRRFLAWRQALERRVRAWVESCPEDLAQRDQGRLLRGHDLAEAERWLEDRKEDLRADERAFIEASARRAKRVRRQTVLTVVDIFLAVSLLSLLLFLQRNEARQQRQSAETARATAVAEAARRATAQAETEEQRNEAEAAQATAEARRGEALARQLAVEAELERDRQVGSLSLSVLLATESMRRLPSLEADQIMRRGLDMLPRSMNKMEHKGEVSEIIFSPDGKWLATECQDGTARVWDAATGQEVARMDHKEQISALAFSPDGKWLATGSGISYRAGGETRVWQSGTWQELNQVEHHASVNELTFSPDSKLLAIASGRTVQIWLVDTWQEIAHAKHRDSVKALAFSPDGEWLATGSWDKTVWIWEVDTWQEVTGIRHWKGVWFTDFSPGGKWLVTGSMELARVWEVDTWQEVASMEHMGPIIEDVAFSPDDKWLVTGGEDGRARVWDAATGEEMARIEHGGRVNDVEFSPDGKLLATGSRDSTGRVWKVGTWQEIARMEHEYSVEAVAFSPDGQWLATGSGDASGVAGKARVWEADPKEEVARIEHDGLLGSVAFSPNGKWLATGSMGTAQVWATDTWQGQDAMKQWGLVSAVAFSPDGQWLATGSKEMARVWKADTWQEVVSIKHQGSVEAMAFSPDGQWLATGSWEAARVWEVNTWQEVEAIGHGGFVYALAFSPDGQWLATGSHDNKARVWGVDTWREVESLEHGGFVYAVAFSPDGEWLVTGSHDGTARVWEVDSRKEVVSVKHGGPVEAVTFSPDGQWLATGSVDNTARVWEVATGKEMARMEHEDYVEAVAFSPDGKRLVTGSYDNTVRVWLWRPEDLIAEACSRLARNLTHEEWQQYIGNEPYRPTCPNLPVPGE